MSSERRLEQRLADWLADGPQAMPERLIAQIMNAVPLERQERPAAWLRLLAAAPALAAVAAGVLVTVAALAFLGRGWPLAPGADGDGDLIAFASDAGGSLDIWTVDPATGTVRQLTDTPATDTMPTWSPDGRAIAFVRDGSLWLMSAAGTDPRIVAPDVAPEGIDWSPDGRSIAYASNRPGAEIRLVAPDGSDDRLLIALDAPFTCCPSWSPSGEELAIAIDETTSGGEIDLYVITVLDRGLRRLTTTGGDDVSPSWSPGGDHIAFQSDASASLSVIAPDGSGLDVLTFVGARGVPSAWSPTADRLAWVDASGELNVISMADPRPATRVEVSGRVDPNGLAWRP